MATLVRTQRSKVHVSGDLGGPSLPVPDASSLKLLGSRAGVGSAGAVVA